MPAYLLMWNPRNYPFNELVDRAAAVQEGRDVDDEWSCGNRRHLPVGSRVFLIKVGEGARGIMASGFSTSPPATKPHYKSELAAKGKTERYVKVKWDRLFAGPLLPRATLDKPELKCGAWSAASSGVEIPPKVAIALELLWSKLNTTPVSIEGLSQEDMHGIEGELLQKLIRHRKREDRLRRKKIETTLKENGGKLQCEVPGCGFDFLETYGDIGRGYAHVHHCKPLVPPKASNALPIVIGERGRGNSEDWEATDAHQKTKARITAAGWGVVAK